MSKEKVLLFAIAFLLGFKTYACLPQVNWASSISFCSGNSIVLNAFNPNSTYLWNTNATTSSITVSTSGTYYVTVTNACGSTSDTIQVFVDSPITVNLGPDRSLCAANLPVLAAPYYPGATYLWQNNSTNSQIAVTQSGTYHVRVTNACGSFYDTVNIELDQPANVNLGPDINNCTSIIDTLMIPAGQDGKITWSNNATDTNLIIVTSPDIYWVQVVNGCGTFSDTIKVTHNQGASLDIGDTIEKCPTGTAYLSPGITGGSFYWSNAATTPSITVSNAGTYWLRYTDNCGVWYDTVYVFNTGQAKVDLGPDTNVCHNTNLYLYAGGPGSVYNWSTGETTPFIRAPIPGTYWVSVNNGCGAVYDSINVSFTYQPIDSIGDSVYYCTGGYIDVDARDWGPTSFYRWDDNYRGRIHRFNSEGNHHVWVGNKCDSILIDFYVKRIDLPTIDLGKDTTVCGPLFLTTGLQDFRYRFLWNGGSMLNHKIVSQSGWHWVSVSNVCGTVGDTILVNVTDVPGIVPPRVATICAGQSINLRAEPNDGLTTFRWSTGATTSSITVSNPGTYYVSAKNICDTLYDSIIVKTVSPINFSLGKDTTICQNQALFLNVSSHGADSVRWSTGSDNQWLPVTSSGTYWVNLYNACGVFSDTITVRVNSTPHRILQDGSFCVGGSLVLDANQPNVVSYRWSTGASTAAITVNSQGWYWVDMTNDCGQTRDSVFVREDHPIPSFDLGNDTIFCTGQLWLEPPYIPGVTYSWQDGTNARRHLASVSGTYWVRASNACNAVSDSITILITGPPKLTLGDSVKFCAGSVFTLNAQNPGCTYLWNDGSTGQYLSSDTAGVYWVTITNPCGSITDSVELITEFPLLNLELGNDTIICKGQQVVLDADYDGVNTIWNTGATSRYITVTTTGLYGVEISNSCGAWTDSIFVEVQDTPVFWLGMDSVICNINGSVYLEGPLGMDFYEWSNGVSGPSTTFFSPGKKWLTVRNKCFEYTDTINLIGEDPIVMDLGPDTVLCFGESLILSPGNVGYPVTWYNGLVSDFREVTRSGTYWATASNSCGVFTDSIKVRFDYPFDPSTEDTLVCLGDLAVVEINDPQLDIVWFDGSTSKSRTFDVAGTYSAALTNTCGTFYKDFEVNFTNCDCPVYLSNAFTPNGDGLNDQYMAVYDCAISEYHLQIFNRWGEMIFESYDPTESWDGTYHGKQAPIGTYNYLLNYGWLVYKADNSRQKRGIINLIR